MLSKQQKLRYGQILRQQMKEKEQKKKMQDMEKRGNFRQQPQMLPIREQPVYMSPQVDRKDNVYMRPSYIDPKQELQKKLESQDYNPFGGSGGGAPNKRLEQNAQNMRNMSQPNQVRMGAEQLMYQNAYNNLPPQRVRTINEQYTNYPPQYHPSQMQSISPQSIGYPPKQQQENMYYQEGSYPSISQQGRIPSNPYQQQPIVQSTREYPSYSNNNYGMNREEPQQTSFDVLMQNQQPINPMIQQQPFQPISNQYPQMSQSIPIQQPYSMPPIEQPQSYNQPTNENVNQEMQEVYKKGGRNLLKLQNETIDQQLMKQRRKQQIQKQLKLQIQEAQRRKKDQKQKQKRAQQEQERRHLQYLAEQKRRVDEEQRKKMEEKQRIIDENLRNLQLKKQMQEEAKRKVQQERIERQRKNRQFQKQKDDEIKRQQEIQRKKTVTIEPQGTINQDSVSVVSSDTSEMEKDFNTALSKEFFRKQREKNNNSSSYQNKKLQQFSNQIQQINHQMAQQRQLMEREIELMRNEAQRAKTDKKKAEEEIQQLKRELKKKMDEENDKLLRALQGNDFRVDNYHQLPPQSYKNSNEHEPNQYPAFTKKPLKQRQNQNLVRRQFEVEQRKFIPHQEQLSQFQRSHVGEMISLDGESKKIPVYLEHSDKLTMSQVENFAKDSSFFQRGGSNGGNKNSPMMKQKFNMKVSESIAEQPDEEREYINNQSRRSNRYKPQKKESTLFRHEKDELDRLVDSRAKSRKGWDQMSSVNQDITKEIQQLLRKKENPIGSNNGRPSSISNAGRQSLAKQGYAYDGLTLNSHASHVGGTLNTNETVDLERINGRNDARLKELRNLGVQTVNTNGDDDLNALDQLLNKYR